MSERERERERGWRERGRLFKGKEKTPPAQISQSDGSKRINRFRRKRHRRRKTGSRRRRRKEATAVLRRRLQRHRRQRRQKRRRSGTVQVCVGLKNWPDQSRQRRQVQPHLQEGLSGREPGSVPAPAGDHGYGDEGRAPDGRRPHPPERHEDPEHQGVPASRPHFQVRLPASKFTGWTLL